MGNGKKPEPVTGQQSEEIKEIGEQLDEELQQPVSDIKQKIDACI